MFPLQMTVFDLRLALHLLPQPLAAAVTLGL
jgi:hypothetical protein